MVATLKYRARGGGVPVVQDMPDPGWDAFVVQFDEQSLVPDWVEGFLDI